MEVFSALLQNEKYIEYVRRIEEKEKDRKFCHHGIEHCLDVARIAYIENLENGYGIAKDLIYTTALLHDIGRCAESKEGTMHDEEGVYLAKELLMQTCASVDTVNAICEAIFNHGNAYISDKNNLTGIIYRADKASRLCFMCSAKEECYWSEDKKNNTVER